MIIKREKAYGDSLRSYSIILDGKPIGKIRQGDTFTHDLPTGTHDLYLKIDWGRSRVIKFNERDDTESYFVCSPSAKAWKAIFAIIYATLLRHRYIELTKVDKL